MLIRCFDLLLEAGRHKSIGDELCSLMVKASLEICEGQQMDMDFEALSSATEAAYLEMIRKKTACLIGVSLQMGALLAGADHSTCMTLYKFGEKFGLGFQVQDDFLDVFGDARLTGKQRGGDILRGKKNFLYIHTYNRLSPDDQKEFNKAYAEATMEQDAEKIFHVYEKLNVSSYTRQMQSSFFEESLSQLENLPPEEIGQLRSLVGDLMIRNF